MRVNPLRSTALSSCSVDAIFAEEDLPKSQEPFLQINSELAKKWPVLTVKKPPMPDHEKWTDVPDKLKYLERWGVSHVKNIAFDAIFSYNEPILSIDTAKVLDKFTRTSSIW